MNSYEKLGRGTIGFIWGFMGIYVFTNVVFTLCEAFTGGGMGAMENVVWSIIIGVIGGLVSGVLHYGQS